MSTVTYPNTGQILVSTALTPEAIQTLFQTVTLYALGINPGVDPAAYQKVRCGWQQTGQPAWRIDQDMVAVLATLESDPITGFRDYIYSPLNPAALTKDMGYTQVWKLHWTIYGPNGADNARNIVTALWLDWAHDLLAASNIYAIPRWSRPTRAPELFEGQWWARYDLELKFNELVKETIVDPAAAGLEVTLITDTGIEENVTLGADIVVPMPMKGTSR